MSWIHAHSRYRYYKCIFKIMLCVYTIIEGSLEVKLPTIWTDGKAEVGRVGEEKRREKLREEKESEERRWRWWEMKNRALLWRDAHLQVKKLKTPHVRNTSGSCDVEKVHAVVARSTFPSQMHKTEHFWKLRWSKSVRRCGAKHISKSEC